MGNHRTSGADLRRAGKNDLRGTARLRAEYEDAMHAAWAAPGVTKVEDHITIGSGRNE